MSLLGRLVHFGWSTHDDRGARVQMYDVFDHWGRGGGPDLDLKSIEDDGDAVVYADPWASGWIGWVFPLILAVPAMNRIVDGRGTLALDIASLTAAGALGSRQVLVKLGWSRRRYAFRLAPDAFRGAMLRKSRCPGCAYPLDAALAEPKDACTVCPECGAAWRLSPS